MRLKPEPNRSVPGRTPPTPRIQRVPQQQLRFLRTVTQPESRPGLQHQSPGSPPTDLPEDHEGDQAATGRGSDCESDQAAPPERRVHLLEPRRLLLLKKKTRLNKRTAITSVTDVMNLRTS